MNIDIKISRLFKVGYLSARFKELFKRPNLKSISFKLLTPILAIALISNFLLGIIGYSIQKNTINSLLEEMTRSQLANFKDTLVKGELENLNSKEFFKDYLLKITEAIAMDLETVPDGEIENRLKAMKKNIGVERIRIVDSDGVSRISSDEVQQDLDFKADEQTKIYLEGLGNENFYTVQENVKTEAGETMYFSGKPISGKQKLVQIGVKTSSLKLAIDKGESAEIAKDVEFGKGGFIIVADKSGKILYHRNAYNIGKNLEDFSWGREILKQKSGKISFELDGENQFASYEENYKREKIIAVLPSDDYVNAMDSFAKTIMFFTLFILSITFLIIIITTKTVVLKRLKSTVEVVKEIEDGNLNIEVKKDRDDEIGDLIYGISTMKDELKDIVKGIMNYSKSSHNMSGHLMEASNSNMGITEEISESIVKIMDGSSFQVNKVKESVEKLELLSDYFGNVLENANQIAENSAKVKHENEQGKVAISNLKQKFNQNMDSNIEVKRRIKHLMENSANIGGIVEVINMISQQTNMLALNANIEATRAGELGLGFGVVAAEIRNLSIQTLTASKQIENIIRIIVLEIEETQKAVDIVSENIVESEQELQNTVACFESLQSSNFEIGEKIEKLHELIANTNREKEEAIKLIGNIERISEANAKSTNEISISIGEQRQSFGNINRMTKDLNEISRGLKGIVGNFSC